MTTTQDTLPGYVDPYPGRKGSERVSESCGRCGGSGDIGYGRVTYNNGSGTNRWCFQCDGGGTVSVLVSSKRATARKHAREALKAQREAIERVEREAAYRRENPDVVADLETLGNESMFALDLADRIAQKGDLTERQRETLRRLAQEVRDEQTRVKVPVPEGRLEVTGEVFTLKVVEGYYGSTLKMGVRDDRGFKVWGTVPRSLDVEKGDRVTFTATLERSAKDEEFGFFSRPTKARRVETKQEETA